MAEESAVADETPPAPRSVSTTWVAGGVVLCAVLVALTAVGFVILKKDEKACTSKTTLQSQLSSPFITGERLAKELREKADERVSTLAATLDGIGKPLGAVGYDYNRFLNIVGLPEQYIAWTKDNAAWTVLDAQSLTPLWGGEAPAEGMTWDASSNRFFTIGAGAELTVAAHRLGDGNQAWCQQLASDAELHEIATAVVNDDLWVLRAKGASSEISRLNATDGRPMWSVDGPAAFGTVSAFSDDLVLVGGHDFGSAYDPSILDERAETEEQVTALSVEAGEREWGLSAAPGSNLFLMGVADGLAVIATVDSTTSTLAVYDQGGAEQWSRKLSTRPAQGTIRAGVILLRGAENRDSIVALDLKSGKKLWTKKIPQQPQFFPYGYDLASAPSTDPNHVLLGSTRALVSVDVRTGDETEVTLPADGINTTYWPYQLAVTEDSIAVVTNAGAVVVEGRP